MGEASLLRTSETGPPGVRTETAPESRYEALVRVSHAIGSHRECSELFQVLQVELRNVIKFDSIGIVQYDEAGDEIAWQLAEGCKQIAERCRADVPEDETITRWVYEQQRPLLVPNFERETRFERMVDAIKDCGIRSGCAFPLTTVHRKIGVLFLGSKEADAYSEQDLSFLSLVAEQIALTIDDALNFAASRKSGERLKLLLDLTNSVVSNLELPDLLKAIAPSVRRVMHCDAVGVYLAESGSNELRLSALDFPESKGVLNEQKTLPIDGSPPGQVYRTGKPLVTDPRDLAAPYSESHSKIVEEGIKVGALFPLTSPKRVLGVLGLARREEKTFTEDDLDFLMQVAKQIATAVENALAYGQISELKNQLSQEKLYLEDEIRTVMNFEEIIGKSAELRRVLRQVETVAPTESTVLIYGETGTGKELVARALHNLSPRAANAFVKLNCAAIPTGLLESELFGHEKGAFTGAIAQRIGRFELAHNGTVFLDEIGEIPLELQPKLLRVLQEREFERLGSARTLRSDARLIAATNRDLASMVERQAFRSDLFYRLNVFPVHIPALRERPEDIPLLVRHFVQHFARQMKRKIESIPSETMRSLSEYHWPGNIRELQNIIERAVILSRGPVLQVALADLKTNDASSKASDRIEGRGRRNVQQILAETERQQILAALDESHWIVAGPSGAASRLGMKRSTLQVRMQKLGITRRTNPA
jgi:formate hydrogenlyase transcriptional activator